MVVTPPAFRQTINVVGTSLKNGTPLGNSDRPNDRRPVASLQGAGRLRYPDVRHCYGRVTQQPQDAIVDWEVPVRSTRLLVLPRTTTCITR